jgi:AcrR family transcriptional regulator
MSVAALCEELGISKPTLYRNLTPEGDLTEAGTRVMSGKQAKLKKNGKKEAA